MATASKDSIEIRFPSRSEYVGVVRLAVSGIAQRCNFTMDEIEDLKIAVTEACSNAVIHGYNGKVGEIVVRLMPKKNELSVEVSDKGVGFDVKKLGKPKDNNKRSKNTPGLGLGLTFIKSLTNELTIKSTLKKGTVISFRKKHA